MLSFGAATSNSKRDDSDLLTTDKDVDPVFISPRKVHIVDEQ